MKQACLGGVKVDLLSRGELLELVKGWLQETGRSRQIVTLNAIILMVALKERCLQAILNQADLVAVDGVGIERALLKAGYRQFERLAGIDLVKQLLTWCAQYGYSIYCYGGSPLVARKLRFSLERSYPGTRICGIRDGFGREFPPAEVYTEIIKLQPKLLLVGLGQPQQELFIAKILPRLEGTVAIGVGGSLEVLAGIKQEAPEPVRRYGWEWFYRMLLDPKRLNRLPDLIEFWLRFLN